MDNPTNADLAKQIEQLATSVDAKIDQLAHSVDAKIDKLAEAVAAGFAETHQKMATKEELNAVRQEMATKQEIHALRAEINAKGYGYRIANLERDVADLKA